MRTKFQGALKAFARLDCGTAFITQIERQNRICVKSFQRAAGNSPDGAVDSFVVLAPGLVDYRYNPCVLPSSAVGSHPVVELDDIGLVTATDWNALLLKTDHASLPAGSVVLSEDGVFLCVEADREHLFLDLESGELFPQPPQGTLAEANHWRLEQVTESGVEVLFRHPSL